MQDKKIIVGFGSKIEKSSQKLIKMAIMTGLSPKIPKHQRAREKFEI
jgi:hypothetical protein